MLKTIWILIKIFFYVSFIQFKTITVSDKWKEYKNDEHRITYKIIMALLVKTYLEVNGTNETVLKKDTEKVDVIAKIFLLNYHTFFRRITNAN